MTNHSETRMHPHAVVTLVQEILAGTEGLYMSDISSSDLEAALDSSVVRSAAPEVAEAIGEELASRAM